MPSKTTFFSESKLVKDIKNNNTKPAPSDSLTEEEIYNLNLLEYEIFGSSLLALSNILIIISGQQSRNLILSRLSPNIDPNNLPNPVYTASIATKISLFAALLLTNITWTRFNELVTSYNEGNINYSIKGDEIIALGALIGTIASSFSMMGTQEILNRDIQQRQEQPIFL